MKTYVDSGVLIKLYVREAFSEEAAAVIATTDQIPVSSLHELEIRNALRAQCGRGILTEREMESALGLLQEDIVSGRLARLTPEWCEVFRIGESLSCRHARTVLCRFLDILHVGLALVWDCTLFVTGDQRQALLCERENLRVVRIGCGPGGQPGSRRAGKRDRGVRDRSSLP